MFVDEIAKLFPHLFGQSSANLVPTGADPSDLAGGLRIGVVLSGGQAPGGHNVISGIFALVYLFCNVLDYLQERRNGSILYGFKGGPAGIMKCKYVELTPDFIYPYRNQVPFLIPCSFGGFDMICSGRDKIETPEQVLDAHCCILFFQPIFVHFVNKVCNTYGYCLIPGGMYRSTNGLVRDRPLSDGTTDWGYFHLIIARNRSVMIDFDRRRPLSGGISRGRRKKREKKRENLEIWCCCPLTIPIGLPRGEEALARLPVENKLRRSRGEETSPRIYSEMIGNVMTDARSTGKYYHCKPIICKVQQLIAELNEILAHDVVDEDGLWKEKLQHQSQLLFEFLPQAIKEQLLLERDPHGNVQVRGSMRADVACLLILMPPIAMHWVTLQELSCILERLASYPQLPSSLHSFISKTSWLVSVTSTSVGLMSIASGAAIDASHVGNLSAPVNEWTVGGTALTSLMDVERRHGIISLFDIFSL
ncbi:hypothetical protein BHE74_00037037 [Ensete ventricosum]|nr:hypothetical protein BHE74_00037037 [Ensete ventricosum]